MIPTVPQPGWEVYKEKQEVMPGITEGHFSLTGRRIVHRPRGAMHPTGGWQGEAEHLLDKVHNL